MKEFHKYLSGIPNGNGTEREIKNYWKQMGGSLSIWGKFIRAVKETCLFILHCHKINGLLSCVGVSL